MTQNRGQMTSAETDMNAGNIFLLMTTQALFINTYILARFFCLIHILIGPVQQRL